MLDSNGRLVLDETQERIEAFPNQGYRVDHRNRRIIAHNSFLWVILDSVDMPDARANWIQIRPYGCIHTGLDRLVPKRMARANRWID